MDPRSFDTLARSLARPQSRRGMLSAALALAAGALVRQSAGAQSTCPPGQSRNRRGDCHCPAGTDPCPDGCFDLKRDTKNCGACGQGCIGGTCRKGECRCPSGSILCNGVCLSQQQLAEDVNNCGACGNVCLSGEICSDGTCLCPTGSAVCDGVCIDVQSDPTNCGGCGISCDDGAVCTSDSCVEGICQHQAVIGRPCAANDGFCNVLGDCQCQIGFQLCESEASGTCCPAESGCNADGTCTCIASGEICTTGINTCAFCCSGAFTCTSGNFGCTCD